MLTDYQIEYKIHMDEMDFQRQMDHFIFAKGSEGITTATLYNYKLYLTDTDPKAVQAAMPFIKDNEKQTKPAWGHSDYNNTRLWLYVDMEEDKPTIHLITEIVPLRYTDEQEQKLLQSASQEKRADTYSDYLAMLDTLDTARNWHAEASGIGEMYLHPAELNDKEMGEVMYTLAQVLREDELQQAKLMSKVFI